MTDEYDFADFDGPLDDDERKTRTRRLFMYSNDALLKGAASERVHVLFPEFARGLEALDRIYQLSGQLVTPQGAVIQGPPGSCKTTLAKYFVKSLPQSNLFEIGFGAILMRLRANPTQGLVVSMLLAAVKYPFTEVRKNRVYTMRDIAYEALRQKGTRLVIVDQAHCLATQIRPKRSDVIETAASDALLEMMDEARVGLVLLVDSNFKNLESIDPALADRVSVRLSLSHFADGPTWRGFVDVYVNKFQAIDLSVLTTEEGSKSTYAATEGNRRSFRRLITEGILIAAEAKSKTMTPAHLSLAFERTRGEGSTKPNPYAA